MDPEALAPVYQALNTGDLDAFLAGIHEDAELHELPEMPDTAVYRGHAEIRRWAQEGMGLLEDWEWVPVEILYENDGVVVARIRFSARGGESGAPFERFIFHVIEFRDGKATRLRGFLSEADAMEAAGA